MPDRGDAKDVLLSIKSSFKDVSAWESASESRPNRLRDPYEALLLTLVLAHFMCGSWMSRINTVALETSGGNGEEEEESDGC